jgi:hypothetical protein
MECGGVGMVVCVISSWESLFFSFALGWVLARRVYGDCLDGLGLGL